MFNVTTVTIAGTNKLTLEATQYKYSILVDDKNVPIADEAGYPMVIGHIKYNAKTKQQYHTNMDSRFENSMIVLPSMAAMNATAARAIKEQCSMVEANKKYIAEIESNKDNVVKSRKAKLDGSKGLEEYMKILESIKAPKSCYSNRDKMIGFIKATKVDSKTVKSLTSIMKFDEFIKAYKEYKKAPKVVVDTEDSFEDILADL